MESYNKSIESVLLAAQTLQEWVMGLPYQGKNHNFLRKEPQVPLPSFEGKDNMEWVVEKGSYK